MKTSFPPHGGNLIEEARQLGIKAGSLLDASASLVPFPLPQELNECLTEAINSNSLKVYPDRSYKSLK